MALSPIKMFESGQSSLSQILQGGNQTISGIMDKAIQIGRDISNKQLAQERDLLAMRQQETNLFQRRAENLQQNIEDAQNFSRRAFESDRRYGLEQQQEQRAGVKDLFAMGDTTRRTDLAERGVAVSEGGLALREQENKAAAAAAQRNADYYANEYGDNQGAAPSDTVNLFPNQESPQVPGAIPWKRTDGDRAFAKGQQLAPQNNGAIPWANPYSARNPDETSPPDVANMLAPQPTQGAGPAPTPVNQQTPANDGDIIKLYRDQERMESDYAGTKDPAVRARIATRLGEVKGRIASLPKPSTRAAKTPEAIELEKLRLESARRKDVKDFTVDLISSNPKAFGAAASGETISLRKFAAEKGMKPEDALWSKEFDEYFGDGASALRQRILDGQIEQEAREVAAINSATSEQAYVDAQPGIGENEKEIRRQLYRKRRGGGGASPGAAKDDPWKAVP